MSQHRSHPHRDGHETVRSSGPRGEFLRARDEQRRGFFDSALAPLSSRAGGGKAGAPAAESTATASAVAQEASPPLTIAEPPPGVASSHRERGGALDYRSPAEGSDPRDHQGSARAHGPRPIGPDEAIVFGEETADEVDGELRVNRRSSCRYSLGGVAVMVGWPSVSDPPHTRHAGAGERRQWRLRHDGPRNGVEPGAATLGALDAGLDPGSFERHPGLAMDISQHGLCVALDQPAPADRQLWVGFVIAGKTSWVEVVLRSLSACPANGFQLRFSFAAGCPYEIFSALVVKPNARRTASG